MGSLPRRVVEPVETPGELGRAGRRPVCGGGSPPTENDRKDTMKPYILPIATAMATSLLTLSLVTYASDSAPTGRPHRAGPPPEALAACSERGSATPSPSRLPMAAASAAAAS